MADLPRTKFNSPWTVAVIEAALNDVSSAKGSSESLTAALNAIRAEINSLSGGVHLKGAVDYYADLPVSPSEGDAYTVRYQGTSGTDPLGIEYAWATYQGTPQWIPIGVDPSVFAKQTEMDVVANAGAKNYAVPYNPISTTDIAVTLNADGSYTFVCTNVSENRVIRVANIGDLPSSSYKFSGTTGGSSSTYMLGLYNTSSTAVKYQHTSPEETYTGNVSGFSLRVRVISGYSGTFTVYPMLRPAAITDPTFQPFSRTNRELTVLTDEDRAALAELVDGGSKNIFDPNPNVVQGDLNGLTPTFNADGTVHITGTLADSTKNGIVYLYRYFDAGAVSGCILSGGINALMSLRIQNGSSPYNTIAKSDGDSNVIPSNSVTNALVYLWVSKTVTTAIDITIKPMICTKTAWEVSNAYQPYRPSYQELYEMVLALQNGTRSLSMRSEPAAEPDEPEEQEER